MVFDSNLDPDRAWRDALRIWQLSAERGFDMFAAWAARHGAYPGDCTDETVTRYLLHGELPPNDVTCQSTRP